jgi:hypothetical protein
MCALAILMRNVNRKSTLVVRHCWVGTCFHKNFDRFKVSVARRPMQWCVTVRLRNVAVGPSTEKITHDFDVSPRCGTKQRSLTDGVPPMYVGTALNQTDDLLKVAAPCRSVESRFGRTIISGKNSVTHL